MRFHGLVFDPQKVDPTPDHHLMSYLTAIGAWEFPTVEAYAIHLTNKYPVSTWTPVHNKEFKIVKAVVTIQIQYNDTFSRDFGILILHSPLIDKDTSLVSVLLSIEEACDHFADLSLTALSKLRKRL